MEWYENRRLVVLRCNAHQTLYKLEIFLLKLHRINTMYKYHTSTCT